jgi:hypothetical protein
MAKMKNFDPNTHHEFGVFMVQYERALDEAITRGRPSHNTAILLVESMRAFGDSINLDAGALDKLQIAMSAWIDLKLPE